MVNSILIGKKINSILRQDGELTTLVSNQIYPLMANKSTSYPFIVYSRDSVTPHYCKDGNFEDIVGVTVVVVSNDYEQSVDIANLVRDNLELLTYEDNDIYIASSEVTGIGENTSDDAYVQKIYLNFRIQ